MHPARIYADLEAVGGVHICAFSGVALLQPGQKTVGVLAVDRRLMLGDDVPGHMLYDGRERLAAISQVLKHHDDAHERVAAVMKVGEDDSAVADRKSTRLNSSHVAISYAVFCLTKNNYMTS